jgi:probable RNA-binding protein EIF1AD
MSGSKRRTCYRKTLQDDVLHGLPEPTASQVLAVIARASGANLFEVRTEHGGRGVALLPTRYRKLVWLKRGDAVILSAPADGALTTTDGGAGAVTHVVEAILYEAALKHLRAIGRLPAALERAQAEIVSGGGGGSSGGGGGTGEAEEAQAAGGGGGGGGDGGSGGGRKLQGPRGLPPPADEEEEEEDEEGEEEGGEEAAEEASVEQ